VTVVVPPTTFTPAGIESTLRLELVNVTIDPALGAGPLIVTFPVTTVEELPCTELGDSERPDTAGAKIVTFAV
jgi:hypothetical protein